MNKATRPLDDDTNEVLDESETDDEGLIDIGESALNYFGADFDVAGLVRRVEERDVVVPRFDPDETEGSEIQGFQRGRVWSMPKMEKFIESLLLGWPVPGIFLVRDQDQRYLVLDGQQRLTSLQHFYSGAYPSGRPFMLSDEVAQHLQGATYTSLSAESKRRLNNTFIQATVVEPNGTEGRDAIYRLYGRLNSGGVTLTSQEIRVALYRGPVIDWLREVNRVEGWRRLFGQHHPRLKDQELVLRIMAMQETVERVGERWGDSDVTRAAYSPPMSEFLNAFLDRNRELTGVRADELKEHFSLACERLLAGSGGDALKFAGRLNAAHADATLGVLTHLSMKGALPSIPDVGRGLNRLRRSSKYRSYVTTGTSHQDSVIGRLSLAVTEFTD